MARTYVVLLFLLLGFCPQDAFAGERPKKIEPFITPLLPAEQAWQVALPFPPSAGPAMDESRVYIPLDGEHFTALDRATGKTLWTVDIESAWPPLVHDGIVYLAASDELHALDAATGTHRWRVNFGRGAMAPLEITQDTLIAITSPDEVWAFKLADGSRLWGTPLGGRTGRASMVIRDGGVYVAFVDRLVCLNLADGKVRWDLPLPGELSSVAIAKDRVFAGSTSNEIYAVDPDRGRLAWKFRFGGDVVGIAATDDRIFVASLDNLLRALNRSNGNQIWKRPLSTRPTTSPQVFEGVVAMAAADSLATFDTRTGMPIGTYDAPNLLQGRPLVDPTPAPFAVSMLVVTRDGRALGLRPVEMMLREMAVQPLTTLPGRPLLKEASPLP